MNIKVSGVNSMKHLRQLEGLGIDYAAIYFGMTEKLESDIDGILIKREDLDLKTIGVFVNADFETIMAAVDEYNLDMVQLSGNESPFLCEKVSGEVEVIKSFVIQSDSDKSIDYMLTEYDEVCDYYQFEASASPAESTAVAKILEAKVEKPFFFSGGFVPSNGREIAALKHPDLFGIDIEIDFDGKKGGQDLAVLLRLLQDVKTKSRK